MIKAFVFDWGDTVMRDFALPGPMKNLEKVAWIPGAETALQGISSKYRCAIATSADHSDTSEMRDALRRVGADKYFHDFFSQKELGYKKPDVKFFLKVAELMKHQPSEMVMVGNLYEKDIVGAKAAGMQTVFFNEANDKGDFSAADIQITQLDQILNYF